MGRSAVPRYFFTIRGRDRGVPNQCNGVRRAADETTTRAGALAGTDGGACASLGLSRCFEPAIVTSGSYLTRHNVANSQTGARSSASPFPQ